MKYFYSITPSHKVFSWFAYFVTFDELYEYGIKCLKFIRDLSSEEAEQMSKEFSDTKDCEYYQIYYYLCMHSFNQNHILTRHGFPLDDERKIGYSSIFKSLFFITQEIRSDSISLYFQKEIDDILRRVNEMRRLVSNISHEDRLKFIPADEWYDKDKTKKIRDFFESLTVDKKFSEIDEFVMAYFEAVSTKCAFSRKIEPSGLPNAFYSDMIAGMTIGYTEFASKRLRRSLENRFGEVAYRKNVLSAIHSMNTEADYNDGFYNELDRYLAAVYKMRREKFYLYIFKNEESFPNDLKGCPVEDVSRVAFGDTWWFLVLLNRDCESEFNRFRGEGELYSVVNSCLNMYRGGRVK